MSTTKTLTEADVIHATSEIDLEAEIAKLTAAVDRMALPQNVRETQRRFQEALVNRPVEVRPVAVKPAPYISETKKIVIGALLRRQVRMMLARDTNLEVQEVKGFLESVFVLTAHSPKQSRELANVMRWVHRLEAEDAE